MILHNHRRLPVSIFNVKISVLGSLKRVTGRILKIKREAQTLSMLFSTTKKQKIVKTFYQRMHIKYFFVIISLQ
jgi:hypothetical protein